MAKVTITMTDDNNKTIEITELVDAETKWEAIDHYIPCHGCDKLVFYMATEIIGEQYMCPVCVEKSKLNFEAIASKGEDTFWEVIAASFPDIKTGDLSIGTTIKLSEVMREAVIEGYHTNKSTLPDPPAEVIISPYKEFNELKLHFGQEWELENTGGNVFVAYLMFYSKKDGEARRIGVSSECIVIYDKPFTNDCVEDYAWFFGDNPTAFLCALEEHATHTEKFNFGKLFDDCQTIAKSGLV